jgi:hypothetical protein
MIQETELQDAPIAVAAQLAPAPAALCVTIVHGTFPRGLWQQLRRNLRALWANIRGRQFDEAEMWPTPAPQPDRRLWFERGSEFEIDLVRRTGLPPGSILFNRFLWSGSNTFAGRAEAARLLRVALQKSAGESPDATHLVIGHSHGGTVAVKALDSRDASGAAEMPRVNALLTLGTPFVRLVSRPGSYSDALTMTEFVDMTLPALILLLAPIMALDLGWHGNSIAYKAEASVLGIAALITSLRISPSGAATIILLILVLGDGSVRQDLIAFTAFLLASIPTGLLIGLRIRREWVLYLLNLERRHVDDEPIFLLCPLLALRAPRDEASLTIGLAQTAQGFAHAIARFVDRGARPLERLYAPVPMGRFSIILFVGASLWVLIAGFGQHATEEISFKTQIRAAVHLYTLIGTIALLAWALPIMAISFATGREAFMLPASTLVDAEPLPNTRAGENLKGAEMSLEILYEARLSRLRHSLYDASEVRERIAVWLRKQSQEQRGMIAGTFR